MPTKIEGAYNFGANPIDRIKQKGGNEVDFILKTEGGELTALEIKTNAKNIDFNSIRAFKKDYSDSKVIVGYFDDLGLPASGGDCVFRPAYLF